MAVDRYERTVKVGDTVHLTYGGDHHMGTVETVHEPQSEHMGPAMVEVTITALVPAAALAVEKGKAPAAKPDHDAHEKGEDESKKADERAARHPAHRTSGARKGGR